MSVPVRKQLLWWGMAAVGLLLVLWLVGSAILPFVLGAGVAYLLDPVADRLERAGLSRVAAVVLITAIAVLGLLALVAFVVPLVLQQATALAVAAPGMIDNAQAAIEARFPGLIPEGASPTRRLTQAATALGEQGAQLAGTLLTSVRGVIGVVALLVIVPVVAFYMLLDWDAMVARIDALLPREHAPTIRAVAADIDDALSGFVRGQGLVMTILGTWYAIGLALVGLPFGVFIGIMAALLSFIPYVGVLIGGATAFGVALFSFWGEPLWIGAVAAIFIIGQVVEGNYLQPKIVGGHVGLHPVWLLLALSVFGALFGFVGLVLAVPLAAALGVLVRFAVARYRDSPLYTGRGPSPDAPAPTLVEIVPAGTAAAAASASAREAERRALARARANLHAAEAAAPFPDEGGTRRGG